MKFTKSEKELILQGLEYLHENYLDSDFKVMVEAIEKLIAKVKGEVYIEEVER